MKSCIYLSYKGLGANLLHLAYCHEIAKKYGPVTIITLCENLEAALKDDPLIEKIIFINKYHKRFIDILKLKKLLDKSYTLVLALFKPNASRSFSIVSLFKINGTIKSFIESTEYLRFISIFPIVTVCEWF